MTVAQIMVSKGGLGGLLERVCTLKNVIDYQMSILPPLPLRRSRRPPCTPRRRHPQTPPKKTSQTPAKYCKVTVWNQSKSSKTFI